MIVINFLQDITDPSIYNNEESREKFRVREYQNIVIQIKIIDCKRAIFRTVVSGFFFADLITKKKYKLFDVEPCSPGDRSFAFNQSKTFLMLQINGHKLIYVKVNDLLKEDKNIEEISLPPMHVEGIHQIKNVKNELFVIRASMDIFIIENKKVIKRITYEMVFYC